MTAVKVIVAALVTLLALAAILGDDLWDLLGFLLCCAALCGAVWAFAYLWLWALT